MVVFDNKDTFDGKAPRYVVQATLFFDSVEGLREAFAKGSEETLADISNYTDVQPEMWIGKVVGTYGE